jgi:glucosamine-6-phosphate deaminase
MIMASTPRTQVHPDPHSASQALATEVADLISSREAKQLPTVLGLATGATPIHFYEELRRLHTEHGLSFGSVITFNLDEYVGLGRQNPQSYWHFMHDQLFDHIDIHADNIHIPDGTIAEADLGQHCEAYEQAIKNAGGIDLQILGIGTTGHIGFNEPGTARDSRTGIVDLTEETRQSNAVFFNSIDDVPTKAISMGCGTILDSKKIAALAWGERKASVVQGALQGPVTPDCPASFLQEHPSATFYLDQPAANALR